MLIGVQGLATWRAAKLDIKKMASHLAPRNAGEQKSAWAHTADRFIFNPQAVLMAASAVSSRIATAQSSVLWVLERAPRLVSRQLQALCLMLLRAHKTPHWPADFVEVVSLNRGALEAAAVVDVPDRHIMSPYDSTHRELTYKTIEERMAAVNALVAKKHRAYRTFEYTFDQLRPLMTMLHNANLLRPEYAATAKRLLAETSQ